MMKRSIILLFIFGLLVFLISGTSAVCRADPNCDCAPANIKDCSCAGKPGGLYCGFDLGCSIELWEHIYQCSKFTIGNFCHLGPCTNGCLSSGPNSSCIKS